MKVLDAPAIPLPPQHQGATTEIAIPDVEGHHRGVTECLDADVLGLETDLRGSAGPYLPQDTAEHLSDGLPALAAGVVMGYGEEDCGVLCEAFHHFVQLEFSEGFEEPLDGILDVTHARLPHVAGGFNIILRVVDLR